MRPVVISDHKKVSDTNQVVAFPGPLESEIGPLPLQTLKCGHFGPHLKHLLWRQIFNECPGPPPKTLTNKMMISTNL